MWKLKISIEISLKKIELEEKAKLKKLLAKVESSWITQDLAKIGED